MALFAFLAVVVVGPAQALRQITAAAAAPPVSVNFQPAGAPVPTGYIVDSGAAYSDTQGYGWVTQASLSTATHQPLDLSPNTRDRNLESDQRLDTIIHMQYPPASSSTTAVKTPGAWEYAVANGTYQVTVAVGDPLIGTDPENHVIHVEGVTAIPGFVPSGAAGSATRHATTTVTATVSDGRLTVDAIGGTNTKLDYVDIKPATADTTPPSAPQNVAASAGDSQVTLSWSANNDSDLAGYNVYRGTSPSVSLSTPLNGATLLRTAGYLDSGLQNGTTYYYVVQAVDTSGNKAQSGAISATPQPSTQQLNVKVNFQDQATVPPVGFVGDWGQAYGLRSDPNQGSGLSYGWVVPGTATPLSLVGNGRNRNNPPYSVNDPDLRLATFIHMQGNDIANFNGIASPGAWELAVPNGSYTVTAAVGDDVATDSSDQIQIEGQTAIASFVPTSVNLHATATKTVTVADGRLTVDANGGKNTKLDYVAVQTATSTTGSPSIRSSSPANGATNVSRNTAVTAEVLLPNVGAGIDEATLTSTNVQLVRDSDSAPVGANLNTSGGGDVIVVQPTSLLDANTTYRFSVNSGLKDLSGASFVPYTARFTTGTATGGGSTTGAAFAKVALPTATGHSFTSVAVGPDGKLYAGTLDGDIIRFPLNADGTTGTAEVISTIRTAEGGPRTIVGLAFDPAATATNPILWVTNDFDWTGTADAPDWSGKITRLSGANLGTVQDYVVGLPRSIRDHETNSLAFGPDGALYVAQGSISSTGDADSAWGNRAEHPLSAAILRVNLAGITAPPLNVKTADGGGSYNPSASGAPVTVYASGLRNAYDLVWHSNGQLYAPTNGAATGGNTPATPSTLPSSCQNRIDSGVNGAYTGPQVPALTNLAAAQDDFLFRVAKGGYYGHPDPSRCEWVLNGGNPTSSVDPAEVTQYPVGTLPDRNWRGSAFDFGLHYSPDGAIEYKGNAFGGALTGKVLVARYSAGDDIIALTPNGTNGDISSGDSGIPGLSGFDDPLDIAETVSNGNLYVTELGAQKITLLRPSATATIGVAPARLIFNDVQGGSPSATQTMTITNSGGGTLNVTALALSGTNANQFQLVNPPALPLPIAPGASANVGVAFNPTTVGPMGASLDITSNDSTTPTAHVVLRGLGTLGLSGTNEPSLQWILDTYQIPVNVGDSDPTDSLLAPTPLLGDEVSASALQKAGSGNVTIEPIAVFGPQSSGGNVNAAGWYISGDTTSKAQLFTVPNAAYQSLQPTTSGALSFDPGTSTFGFYSIWPFFSNREVYQQDALNTWEPTVANRHKVRVYPLKATDGSVTPNAYVVAFEETTSAYDYQDLVFVVRNVKPVSSSPPPSSVNVNFEPAGSPVPSGYVVDSGGAYSDTRGFGWVTEASLSSSSHQPLDLSPNTRDRNLETDQRLDTLIHMQYPPSGSSTTAVKTPGAWEYALANGSYQVTVAVGDPLVGSDAENYVVHVEGVTAVAGYVPSGVSGSATRHAMATVTVSVSDGRLTVDAIGGTNTKLDYVQISPTTTTPDTTPPAPPQNVAASPGDSQVTLSWSANSEPDFAGYNVYRSTTLPVAAVSPLNGTTLLKTPGYTNTGLQNQTTYYYVVEALDTSGNRASAPAVSATPQGSAGALNVKVNFQDQATVPPAGYAADWGEAYGARSGANQGSGLTYGWVMPGTSTPLSLVGNGRNRNNPPYSANGSDLRLATLVHMQGNDISGFSGVTSPGAWELAVPNGTYTVTVAVGDDVATDSTNEIQVEGQTAIAGFIPTASARHATASKVVTISDGRLTIDAAGGKNTKIDYVTVATGSNAPAFTTINWSTAAPALLPRAEAEGAVVNGKLYVFGGYLDGSFTPTNRMDVYDPATNTWRQLASLPLALSHIGVAADAHNIYIAGGYPPGPTGTYQTFATTSVSRYDVDTNTWSAMPSLPAARGGGALALANGILHFFGGSDINRSDATTHWTLPLTGTAWQTSTALPAPRNHLGGVTLNGTIYAVGGQQGQDAAAVYRADVDRWDAATASWKSAAPLPSARSHISGATFAMNGRIIVLGGETSYQFSTSQALAYDPVADSWTQLTPLPVAIHSGVAGDLSGTLYYTTGAFQQNTYKGVPTG